MMAFESFPKPNESPDQNRDSRHLDRATLGIQSAEELLETIENLPADVKQRSARDSFFFERIYPTLAETHETHQAIQKLLERVLDATGLPKDFVRLRIYQDTHPEAMILPISRELRIAGKLVEALHGDPHKIMSIVAHEVGHLMALRLEQFTQKNDFDPLNEHVQGYHEEYVADRFSLLLCNRLGIRRTALAEALADLDNDRLTHKPEEMMDVLPGNNAEEYNSPQAYMAWISSTHPHSKRRSSTMERASRWLPKYTNQIVADYIPAPSPRDFRSYWKSPFLRYREHKKENVHRYSDFEEPAYLNGASRVAFPDCIWDEVEVPRAYIEQKGRETLTGDSFEVLGKPHDFIGPGEMSVTLFDETPEQVAQWEASDEKKRERWWIQALMLMQTRDGYADTADDIAQYPASTTRLLLLAAPAELDLIHRSADLFEDIAEKDQGYARAQSLQECVFGDSFGDYGAVKADLLLVISLLIRQLEVTGGLQTIEGIEDHCQFLQEFQKRHGARLPSSGVRYFRNLEQIFIQATGQGEQEHIAKMVKDNYGLLTSGDKSVQTIVPYFAPTLFSYLKQHGFEEKKPKESKTSTELMLDYQERQQKSYALPDAIATEANQATPARAQELLNLVPRDFTVAVNYTNKVTKFGAEHISSSGRVLPDWMLDVLPQFSVNLLSTAEFEEAYFKEGRAAYKPAEYLAAEKDIREYRDIESLWKLAGYAAAAERLPQGAERALAIINTFPARCSRRDQLIAAALGWPALQHMEDVSKLSEPIEHETNPRLLLALAGAFYNPVLAVTISQRLWKLSEQDKDAFLAATGSATRATIDPIIAALPNLTEEKHRQLTRILTCFPQPSFIRDEHLRELIDGAPDEASTFALAGLLAEAPPSVIKQERRTRDIMITETLLDASEYVSEVDRIELMLYFLGHRSFISGFDAPFFPNQKTIIESVRVDRLFLSPAEFKKKYKGDKDAKGVVNDYQTQTPDALTLLIKGAGIPVSQLLEEHSTIATEREQRDFITHILTGGNGILQSQYRDAFLRAAARSLVERSGWADSQGEGEKKNFEDLMAFALAHCPPSRLPDLFLGFWTLQRKDQASLPEVVAGMLRTLGSVFIKAGQYLATQTATLPPEWTRAFRQLSDRNRQADKTLVYEQTRAQFGAEPPFRRIGAKVGEGSMAAVYDGELIDGSRIALKVSHPNTLEELPADVHFLKELVRFINERRKEFGLSLPENLASVAQQTIGRERDFEVIQRNSQDITQVLERSQEQSVSWRVPRLLIQFSTPEIATYEYSTGVSIDRLPAEQQPAVKAAVGLELLRQILIEGVYQADPSLGNFSVRSEEGRLVVDWLDTDHVGRLDHNERLLLQTLLIQLVAFKDPDLTARTLAGLLEHSAGTNEELLIPRITQWLTESRVLTETSGQNFEEVLTRYLDFLADERLVLKPQYVTLLRALGLMKPLLTAVPPEKLIALFASISS